MEDQFYVHLFSNASDNYFPGKRPWEFMSMLPEPLVLQGGRRLCALTEIEYSRSNADAQLPLHLAVYSDICLASTTGSEKSTLLRYIPITRRKGQRIFHTPFTINYILVNKNLIDRIDIAIKCPGSSPQSLFSAEPCRVTLHFSRCPPSLL